MDFDDVPTRVITPDEIYWNEHNDEIVAEIQEHLTPEQRAAHSWHLSHTEHLEHENVTLLADNSMLKNENMDLSEHLAFDDLTGLESRFAGKEKGEALFLGLKERARYNNFCVMIDLDGFKEVNDTLGHEAGDRVLTITGHYLMREDRLQSSDTKCRWGGDEIMLLLYSVNPHQKDHPKTPPSQIKRMQFTRVEEIISKLVRNYADVNTHYLDAESDRQDKYVPPVTMSAGIARINPGADSFTSVVKHADTALYKAKRRGGNQVIVYSDSNGTPTDHS